MGVLRIVRFPFATTLNPFDKREKRDYNKIVMERIYLDHAATTPLSAEVLQAMLPYYTENYGNADSPHGLGRRAMQAVDDARDGLAAAIGAKPSEIYFTSGGTEADNWAIVGGALAAREKGRDEVLLSAVEHHAALFAGEQLRRLGFSVRLLPVDENGVLRLECLEAALSSKTALVGVMAANNETGVLQPVAECARLARAAGAIFFTDAVQYAPYYPLDVKAMGADMLSLSAHKFYGPKGCGALYIRGGVKIERLIGGGEQERGLRGGTTNVPSVVGLCEAYRRNKATMAQTNAHLQRLCNVFSETLSPLSGVSVNGGENRLFGVLNLRFSGVRNTDLAHNLDLRGVCVSVGSACASGSTEASHVLLAMGMTEEAARESVRFSFGKDNTEAEVRAAATTTAELVRRLRGEA